MSKCLMCGVETEMIINIDFTAKPLCDNCSFTISMQTLRWLVDNHSPQTKAFNTEQNESTISVIGKSDSEEDGLTDRFLRNKTAGNTLKQLRKNKSPEVKG